MDDIRKKLDELIQKSKGVALLDADQREQLVSYIQSASDEDLEALYKVLLHELERVDFNMLHAGEIQLLRPLFMIDNLLNLLVYTLL